MNTFNSLKSIGEPFAAGLFENEDQAPVIRYANALKHFWKAAKMPDFDGGMLYPCGVNTFNFDKSIAFRPHYSNTNQLDEKALRNKSEEAYRLVAKEIALVKAFNDSPHTVGGMGWTHSFPNYEKVLTNGLDSYRERIIALPDGDFKKGMLTLFDGIDIYHSRCLSLLKEQNAPQELIRALEKMPYKPAESIYEALVSINFIYYIDGCDDIGPLDKLLSPYHKGENIVELLRELFRHVDENDGWSGTLGPDYNDITLMCLQAIQNGRRPNIQLLVKRDMPDVVWDACVASLSTSCGQPSMYNYQGYMDRMRALMPEIPSGDLSHLAFGGCTETMLEGMSNVGSDDAGINVALVFSKCMRDHLAECDTYECFFDKLTSEIRKTVAQVLDLVNEYRKSRALYRPAVVRTLLVDDCIDTQTEFNAGGARWMWSVVNMAGTINVIDSLNAIKSLVYDSKKYTPQEFIRLLDAKDAKLLSDCEKCPTYGNDNNNADFIGKELIKVLTEALKQRNCYPRGHFYAVSNQFTTYVNAGKRIPATPDGRCAGAPLCDSLGAIHGNDNKGPTALLNSVCKLPLSDVIGTPVVNIRISKEHLPTVLKPLVISYFISGGMQLQVSCLSREEMLDALVHPDDHKSLVVRVGGFSEYFNRLSPELKQTVIERTEH